MVILFDTASDGICIRRCFGLDTEVQLPAEIDGKQVVRLAPYAFSDGCARAMRASGGFGDGVRFWDSESGQMVAGDADTEAFNDLPAIMGERLVSLTLPESITSVGAYAFYGCRELTRLAFADAVLDWGAGVFTGCTKVSELLVTMMGGARSCLQEVLLELRQRLFVSLYQTGEHAPLSCLLFPEFYEDSVENTPARIVSREIYGCGLRYRYCFSGQEFDFHQYDSLFYRALAEETGENAARLALRRLTSPYRLLEPAKEQYESFLGEHPTEAARAAFLEMDFPFSGKCLAIAASCAGTRESLEEMADEARRAGQTQALAFFMDQIHERFGARTKRVKRFQL